MTNKQKWIAISMLLAIATLAACGGGGSGGDGSAVPTVPLIPQMGGAIQGTPLTLTNTSTVSTLAGLAINTGSVDATGTAARFGSPYAITTEGTNIYVADMGNHTIRKIVIATGAVTTIAGTTGISGSAEGTGTAASFNSPRGITTDGTNLYVADMLNNKIRKIVIATGAVTTLAGAGTIGDIDGTGTAAKFINPVGITTDGTNLYVADMFNSTIRKIVISSAVVTTLAGKAQFTGPDDGTGSAARFNNPYGITTDGTNLYVADTNSNTIRKIVIASAAVTTLAGAALVPAGSLDGTGSAARFNGSIGLTSDGTSLYIADTNNNKVRKIVIATGVVTTLAGTGTVGSTDGAGVVAQFRYPAGITTDGVNLYVADSSNRTVRKIQ